MTNKLPDELIAIALGQWMLGVFVLFMGQVAFKNATIIEAILFSVGAMTILVAFLGLVFIGFYLFYEVIQ